MKHLIWSSQINLNDWQDFLEEENIDADDIDEAYARVTEMNDIYLDDERANLDIEVPEGLVVFGDVGRWNGRRSGIISVEESNISDCLQTWDNNWMDMDIEVDDENNLLITGHHHDGTDLYTIRKWKSAEIGERVICMLDDGELDPAEAYEYTEAVGDLIKKVYGWK